jgi:hypothetical protein
MGCASHSFQKMKRILSLYSQADPIIKGNDQSIVPLVLLGGSQIEACII